MKTLFKIFLLLIITSNYYTVQAQKIVGVIYNKTEAVQKFGEVKNSIEMSSDQLKSLLKESGSYLMYNIVDKKLYILDENRKPLYPNNISVKSNEVFKKLSVSKILELLDKGKSNQTFFEEREKAFSISNGNYTLEMASYCPPFCKL